MTFPMTEEGIRALVAERDLLRDALEDLRDAIFGYMTGDVELHELADSLNKSWASLYPEAAGLEQ